MLQQVYAAHLSNNHNYQEVEQLFTDSLESTYNLYFYLLNLIDELTQLHSELTEIRRHKHLASAEEKNPNMRLINNRLTDALGNSQTLIDRLNKYPFAWKQEETLLRQLLKDIVSSTAYEEYLQSPENEESDVDFWINALKDIVFVNPDLDELLENYSVYWDNPQGVLEKVEVEEMGDIETLDQTVAELEGTDFYSAQPCKLSPVQVVKEFVIKTLKRYRSKPTSGVEKALLPMYQSKQEGAFGLTLLRTALAKESEYQKIIEPYYINWEQERVADIDTIILILALVEALNFPDIPLKVTLNEYIELAKMFSTTKSGQFVNGVLGQLFADLQKEKKLLK